MDEKLKNFFSQLRLMNNNNSCVDCGANFPQWASGNHFIFFLCFFQYFFFLVIFIFFVVSFGIWICLECSGKHRGLGVHISFVRSIAMDSWNEKQLLKMKCKYFLFFFFNIRN